MAAWKKARWAATRASFAAFGAEAPALLWAPPESGGMAKTKSSKADAAFEQPC
jgi:hypothetical protein